MMGDFAKDKDVLISRQAAIDAVHHTIYEFFDVVEDDDESPITYKDMKLLELNKSISTMLKDLPSAQPEIIRCKDCKHWRQQTNYQGAPLSFGFCESDGMWQSLYGETYEVAHIDTDEDFYCGYAKRRTDE